MRGLDADVFAADCDDPESSATSWRDAPRAIVPVSLRERGDTTQRGRPTPVRDRRRERELIERDRERSRAAAEATAAELLSCADSGGRIDGARMSVACFSMLRELVSRSGHGGDVHADVRTVTEPGIRCTVTRVPGASTVVECPDGRLVMHGLVVSVADPATARASSKGSAGDGADAASPPDRERAGAPDRDATIGAELDERVEATLTWADVPDRDAMIGAVP